MSNIINFRDYNAGYDEGYKDGRRGGYIEAHDIIEKEYEGRIAKLVVEIRELDARVAVISKRLD